MKKVNAVELSEYFICLKDKQAQSIVFVDDYFQIYFVDGIISALSETFITTPNGTFNALSKEGVWELVQLIKRNVVSIEEIENNVVIKIDNGSYLETNIRLGPAGENFNIRVNELTPIYR